MKLNTSKLFDYEHELHRLFKYFPSELVEVALLPLVPNTLTTCQEELTVTQCFYQELNIAIQQCLAAYQKQHSYPEPELEEVVNLKNLQSIAKMLKEIIPIEYIFCNEAQKNNCSLTIVLDQYLYRSVNEVQDLVSLSLLGYQNLSCKIYTYGTFINLIKQGHFYYVNLCEQGNCIYQKNSAFNLPLPEQSYIIARKGFALANFNQQQLKVSAFLNNAKNLYQTNEFPLAAFMLQQACEFTYNSILTVFKGKTTKSHDLFLLRKQASHYLPSIIGLLDCKPKKEVFILNQIQQAYVSARYDQHYSITSENFKIMLTATEQLILNVRYILKNSA